MPIVQLLPIRRHWFCRCLLVLLGRTNVYLNGLLYFELLQWLIFDVTDSNLNQMLHVADPYPSRVVASFHRWFCYIYRMKHF